MSNNRPEDGCFSVLFGLIIFWGIGHSIHQKFFIKISDWLFWIGYLFSIFGVIYLLIILWPSLNEWRAKRAQRKWQEQLCPHGVAGGFTSNLCSLCMIEKQEAQRQHELKLQYQNLYQKIKEEECERINRFYVQNENYIRNKLTPQQFEDLVSDVFQRLGYSVEQTPYVNDGGKDAYMRKNGKIYLLECKHYSPNNTIGRPDLQKFYAAMIDSKAHGGYFVNLGKFSSAAISYAQDHSIQLIDLDALLRMMKEAYGENDPEYCRVVCVECGDVVKFPLDENILQGTCKNGHTVNNYLKEINRYRFKHLDDVCPSCGRKLRVIKGRHGKFWGCTGYPACKFTKKYNSGNSNTKLPWCGTTYIDEVLRNKDY